MTDNSRFYRHSLSLFVGLFLFVLVTFTMEKTGIPRGYILALTAISLAALWGIASFPGGTTTARRYFLASGSVRTTINGLAMSTCLFFPLLLGQGGGVFFSNPSMMIVIAVAITAGLGISALVAARPIRQSGVTDLSQFLIARFDSTLLARLAGITTSLCGFALAACSLAVTGGLASWFFAIEAGTATAITIVVAVFAAVLGGSNSLTRLAAIAAVVLLVAVNLPLLLNSLNYSGFPLGHFSFGSGALVDMWDLEDQLTSLQIPRIDEVISEMSPLLDWQDGQQVAAGLVIMAAIVFFPPLVQQYALSSDEETVTIATAKSILFAGLFTASLVAMLAFTEFGLYQTLLGLSLSEARVAAPLLYSWTGRSADLVTICGSVPGNPIELLEACPEGINHVVSIQDLNFNSGLLLAGAPELTALPFAYTALMTAALLLAGTGFTAAIVLSVANGLSSAFMAGPASMVDSRRVFVSRVLCAIIGIGAGAFAHITDTDMTQLFFLALSVLAGTLVPVMIGALYLPRAGQALLCSAFAAGLATAILYFTWCKYGFDFAEATGDELRFTLPGMATPIPPQLSGIYALLMAFLVIATGIVITTFSLIQEPLSAQEDD